MLTRMIFVLVTTIFCLTFATAQVTLIKVYGMESIFLETSAESIDICYRDGDISSTIGRLRFQSGKMTIFRSAQFNISFKRGLFLETGPQMRSIFLKLDDIVYVRQANQAVVPSNKYSLPPIPGAAACFQVILAIDFTQPVLSYPPLMMNQNNAAKNVLSLAPENNSRDSVPIIKMPENNASNVISEDSISNIDDHTYNKLLADLLFQEQTRHLRGDPHKSGIERFAQVLASIKDDSDKSIGKTPLIMPIVPSASNQRIIHPLIPPPLHDEGQVHQLQATKTERKPGGTLISTQDDALVAQVGDNFIGLLLTKVSIQVILPGKNGSPINGCDYFLFLFLDNTDGNTEKNVYCLALLGDILKGRLQYTPEGFQRLIGRVKEESSCRGINIDLRFTDIATRSYPSFLNNAATVRAMLLISRIRSLPLEAQIRNDLGLSQGYFDMELIKALDKMPALKDDTRFEYLVHLQQLVCQANENNKSINSLIARLLKCNPLINLNLPIPPKGCVSNNHTVDPIGFISGLLNNHTENLGALILEFIEYYRKQGEALLYLETKQRELATR